MGSTPISATGKASVLEPFLFAHYRIVSGLDFSPFKIREKHPLFLLQILVISKLETVGAERTQNTSTAQSPVRCTPF
jgi:hypothetical protein